MCWPHWCRVPKALNKAIFAAAANLRSDPAAYRKVRDEGIAAVVEKERLNGPTDTAICMMPNCRKRAPAAEPFCAAHR
jgi:hypothetical protein